MLDIMAIHLDKGLFALVDSEDYERLSKYKWYAKKGPTTYYAVRNSKNPPYIIRMHREILGTKQEMETDHRNHAGLDNRKQNLRECTHTQNQQNRRPNRNSSSRHKGVSWDRRAKLWKVQIRHNKKKLYLGCFKDEEDAAKAYDNKARELFGEFAHLNFPQLAALKAKENKQ